MSWESSIEYYRLVNEATRDAARRAALGRLPAALGRLRRDRGAPARRAAGTRPARGSPREARGARGGRRGAARAVHEHDAQGGRRDHGRDRRSRSCTSPTRPPTRSARAGLDTRRPARDRLHDGAGLLRRPAARSCTGSRCSCPTRPTAGSSTTSSTTSCASASSTTLARRVPADHRRPRRPRRRRAILLGCTEIDLLVGAGGLAGAGVRHDAPARRARGRAGARRLQPAGRMTVTPGPAPSLIATSASGTSSSPISRVTRSPGRSRPAWTSASISG